MHCEARVGNIRGDIGELVNHNLQGFSPFDIGRADVRKYASVRREQSDSYLFMVSGAPYPEAPHNFMVTVMGPQEQRVKELMIELERKIPFPLRPAPQKLQRFYNDVMNQLNPILQYL